MIISVLAGIVLGVVDLLMQKTLPYPWANLANSSAVWAVLAFLLGYHFRTPWWRSTLAGTAMLVVAVPSYYVAAHLIQNDNLSNAWGGAALIWMFFGLLAGALFGFAGHLARRSDRPRVVGLALPAAVLFAEAILSPIGSRATTILQLILGVLVIALLGRGIRERLLVLAAAIPLAALGYVAFLVGGFKPGA